ncbi:MAG: hypothetical protein ACFFDN_39265 [Candidatus Hodarchaeota archaeon]
MGLKEFLEKITERFDPIFDKVNVGYFGILVAITGVATISIASFLYSMVESFTIFSHWISNLGGAWTNLYQSPNGSNIVFSVGLIILCIITIPFIVYLVKIFVSRDLNSLSLFFAIGSGLITLIGLIGVAFFDLKTQPVIHTFSAAAFFGGGLLMVFFFSLAMLSDLEISKIHPLFGLIVVGTGLIFLITFLPHLLQGADLIGLIVSTETKMALSRFWEWIYVFALFAWIFDMGVYTLRLE